MDNIRKKTKINLQVDNEHKWGFIREKQEQADKAGITTVNGINICRTGLKKYLLVVFPQIPEGEWHDDKRCDEIYNKIRRGIKPDFWCNYENSKYVIEFDGPDHYNKPDEIRKDKEKQEIYEKFGYTVIHIPYFIQLTNEVVKTMFGVEVHEELFDPNIPSMASKGRNTPAYCCPAGLIRMAKDFMKYPQQYQVNIAALEKENDEFLTGCEMLKQAYKLVNTCNP